jgi:hypothetical protein
MAETEQNIKHSSHKRRRVRKIIKTEEPEVPQETKVVETIKSMETIKPVKDNLFNYVEDIDYSPMKNNVIDQCLRIKEFILNPTILVKNYNSLRNGIISSLNTMLESYDITSKQAIKNEIEKNVINNIDFNLLKERLVKDLKNNEPLKIKSLSKRQKLSKFKLPFYDTSYIESLFIDADSDEIKSQRKFRQTQKLAIQELNNVIESLSDYENNMCEYRDSTIRQINDDIDVLYSLHANYAKQLKNKMNPDDTISVGNVVFKLKKSQSEFIKSSLPLLFNF